MSHCHRLPAAGEVRLAEEDLRDKVAKLDAAYRCGGRDVRVPRWRGRGEAALEPWYSRAACSRSKRPLTLGSLDGADSPTKALTWRALWPGKRWLTLTRLHASGGSPAAGAMEAAAMVEVEAVEVEAVEEEAIA